MTTGRHYKNSKELFSHRKIQGFSISSFRHCDVGGVTRPPCILIHNIKESGSVQEETSRKVIRKLYAVLRVGEQCYVGCTVPTIYDTGMEDVREISTHPSPSQLQEKFRVPCVLRRMGWGVRRITSG